MRSKIKIQNKEIVFASELARLRFMERADGMYGYIETDDAPTGNMRRYFEGALIPAIFYQHPRSGWVTFKDAREAIKLEFFHTFTLDLKGNRAKVSRSTTELSKEGFSELLERITSWMLENGLDVPNPEEYKAWSDSAPPSGEVFPQLARLKATYDRIHAQTEPPWRTSKYAKNASQTKKQIPLGEGETTYPGTP